MDYSVINVKVETDKAVDDFKNLSSVLSGKQINRAISRAINETLRYGKKDAKDAIKQVYTISELGMKKAIGIERATTWHKIGLGGFDTYLTGAIVASSTPVAANYFKLSFSYRGGSTSTISKRGVQKTKLRTRSTSGGGVTFEAIRGHVEVYQHAFLLPTLSARVFARGQYKTGSDYGWIQRLGKGSRRTYAPTGNDSVKPLIGVSVHGAAINPNTQKIIYSHIQPMYAAQIERHLGLITNGITN
jgi:hypothetical protein